MRKEGAGADRSSGAADRRRNGRRREESQRNGEESIRAAPIAASHHRRTDRTIDRERTPSAAAIAIQSDRSPDGNGGQWKRAAANDGVAAVHADGGSSRAERSGAAPARSERTAGRTPSTTTCNHSPVRQFASVQTIVQHARRRPFALQHPSAVLVASASASLLSSTYRA